MMGRVVETVKDHGFVAECRTCWQKRLGSFTKLSDARERATGHADATGHAVDIVDNGGDAK